MDWLSQKIDNFWLALKAFVVSIFTDLFNFIVDLPVLVLSLFLDAITSIFAAIPLPQFLQNGLSSLFGALDNSILYLLTNSGLFDGLLILGSGVSFRILRKMVTLGQW